MLTRLSCYLTVLTSPTVLAVISSAGVRKAATTVPQSIRQNWCFSAATATYCSTVTPTVKQLHTSAHRYNQAKRMHEKARMINYPVRDGTQQVKRFPVPDDNVDYSSQDWEEYSPVEYTDPFVLIASWADPEIGATDFNPEWNQLDGKVNRQSHEQEYYVDKETGRPRNIRGRTGLSGRGILGRWGPNHAADPVVTRWQRDENGDKVTHSDSGKNILEFVCIERNDGGGWAIPGGMVDPGEKVATTLKREFMEEAMDSTQATREENAENSELVDKFFSEGGSEVYKGYVDDPRNTDNAWMETVVMHFHDESGDRVGNMRLKAGDDAKNLKWMAIDSNLTLYASHKDFVEKVAKMMDAHW